MLLAADQGLVLLGLAVFANVAMPTALMRVPLAASVCVHVGIAIDAFRLNRPAGPPRRNHSRAAWVGSVTLFAVAYYALPRYVDDLRWRYAGHTFRLEAASMAPALAGGDYVFVRPIDQGTIRRGDIIVFRWPEDTTQSWMKRVVGLPGDTLAMRGKVLELNGRRYAEPYAAHDSTPDHSGPEFDWQAKYLAGGVTQASAHQPSRDNWGPIVVPQGKYFVLGDNRETSLDSRYWGFVPADYVFALPWRIYFSRDPESGAVRWQRIGRFVGGSVAGGR